MGTTQPSNSKATRHRRRQYIVDARFQWRTTLLLMGCVFVGATCTGLVLLNVCSQIARNQLLDPLAYDAGRLWSIVAAYGLTSGAICALGFGVWSILFTHRISGPIYAMHQWLRRLKECGYAETRALRKKDQFQAFAQDLADVIRAWQSDAHAQMTGLGIALDDLGKAASERDENARRSALTSATKRLRELHGRLADTLPGAAAAIDPLSFPTEPATVAPCK